MEERFDGIIIGFGKGGKTLAANMANRGLKVALIEKSPKMYGGTCINLACIPTKSLENSSNEIKRQNFESYEDKNKAYREAIDKKEVLITALRKANFNKAHSNENITVFTGVASFEDNRTVKVVMEDTKEVKVLKGDKIFINTGTLPFIPNIEGVNSAKNVFTSETLMNLRELPKELIIIGAGFIGQEFASIYSGFGSKVTLLNNLPQILMNEDKDDVEEILKLYEKKGIDLINEVNTKKVYNKGERVVVETEDGRTFEGDALLLSTGRKANIEGLNLEKAGVETNERGFIKVSDTLKTTADDIWALGDINGGLQFTYISLDDFRIVFDNLFGEKKRKISDRRNIATSTFIDPTFSRVGLTVEKAKEEGYDVMVAKMPVNAIPRAKQIGETDGFLKVVINKDNDKILGASFLCVDSSELINIIKMAMDNNISYKYLRDNIYTHPTIIEGFNELFTGAYMK
ncbi:FAD-dependent oxidoreductase [Clostridium sardiniense]|uniref:FAD-dependent oxidoreductase n=1 Tax=Clostridium sardiniense TaxID=29369 RepID=UPI003D344CFB